MTTPSFGHTAYGPVQLDGFIFDHMDERLDMMFGSVYSNLHPGLQALLIVDFTASNEEERRDYAKNIGTGNLESYAKVLAAQLSR